jgi:hypothetical protein
MGERESSVGSRKRLSMSLPYRFFYEGVQRMMGLMKNDCFIFIVNGHRFETSIAEAILLSPAIYERLMDDGSILNIVLRDDGMQSEDFQRLLSMIRGSSTEILISSVKSMILICKYLGNSRLESFFRSAFSNSDKTILIDCDTYFDVDVNTIASNFRSYSNEDLRSFGVELLDMILSSSSLRISSETSLLNCIVDLGPEFRSLIHHIHVEFLSSSGLRQFVEHISISDINDDLLQSMCNRLSGFRDETFYRHRWTCYLPSEILSKLDSWPSFFDEIREWNSTLLY